MIPVQLTLSNFMCYRADPSGEALTLRFDGLHVVCLSGENGAGKSALLDAITWALWGKARVADDDLIAQGASEMFVDLEFQLGAQLYRVRRARQRGGVGKRGEQTAGKSQLDLFVWDGDRWRTLSEHTIRETQERINNLLRMSYQTFINASFLLQGRADEFTSSTPAERKKVLADILDLGEYAALEARAKERARSLDDQLKGLRGRIDHLARQAEQVPFWEKQVQAAEKHMAQVEARQIQIRDAYAVAYERVRALETRAERRKEVLQRLAERQAELRRHDQELTALRSRIAKAEAILARRAEIQAGLQALAEARARVEHLDALRDRYELLAQRHHELRQQFAEEKARLRERLRATETRLEELDRLAARREAIIAELEDLDAALKALVPLAAEREQRTVEIQDLTQRLGRLEATLHRRDSLQATIAMRRQALLTDFERQRADLERLAAQLVEAERWSAELTAARADQATLVEAEQQLMRLRADEQAAVERLSTLRATMHSAQNELQKLRRNRDLLDEGAGVCPVCGSSLGAEGIAEVCRHYDAELAHWQEVESVASREMHQIEAGLAAIRTSLADLETTIAGLRRSAARIETLEHQLASADALRAEVETRHTELELMHARIAADDVDPSVQAELTATLAELERLGDRQELQQQRRMVEERLAELERHLQQRGQLEGRQNALREELRRIEANLQEQASLAAEAADLRRMIETNDFAHAIRNEGMAIRAAMDSLGYTPEDHAAAREQVRALAHWETAERDLIMAEQSLSRDQELLRQHEELRARDAAEIDRLNDENAMLTQELRELPAAATRLDELQRDLAVVEREVQAAQRDYAEKSSYLRQAQAAAAELEQARSEERALQERAGLFAELAEAFGKKGVQAMLIETAIPQLEDEANRILGRMTDNQMHVHFEMLRDTRKGDPVETLEIRIADALGTRMYDAFSGGEAMRVNFAIRIALSRLLAHRAGTRLETLVIDEGFGALDAVGRERMIEAITSIQDDFKRIIVITHIDELKERFPAQIEVTKTPNGSRWTIR